MPSVVGFDEVIIAKDQKNAEMIHPFLTVSHHLKN
jgi:hypothetical protein